ncbi:hypothetical protein PSAC2689_210003 [Paraburkholderia sacchari]
MTLRPGLQGQLQRLPSDAYVVPSENDPGPIECPNPDSFRTYRTAPGEREIRYPSITYASAVDVIHSVAPKNCE